MLSAANLFGQSGVVINSDWSKMLHDTFQPIRTIALQNQSNQTIYFEHLIKNPSNTRQVIIIALKYLRYSAKMLAILRLRRGLAACCVQLHCGTVLLTNFDLVSWLYNFIIANKRNVGASLEDYHSRTTSKWPIARKKRHYCTFQTVVPDQGVPHGNYFFSFLQTPVPAPRHSSCTMTNKSKSS